MGEIFATFGNSAISCKTVLPVRAWRIFDKDAKEARNKRIFDLWMSCHTQEEIAEREDCTKETVSQICQKMAELPKSDKPAAEHLTDFEVPFTKVPLCARGEYFLYSKRINFKYGSCRASVRPLNNH